MKKTILFIIVIIFIIIVYYILFFFQKATTSIVYNEDESRTLLSRYINVDLENVNSLNGVMHQYYSRHKKYFYFSIEHHYVEEFFKMNEFEFVWESSVHLPDGVREIFNVNYDLKEIRYDMYYDSYKARLYVIDKKGIFIYIR